MGKKSINRTARSMRLFLLALVAAFLLPVAASSAADKVANPGPFTATISGGMLGMHNGTDFEAPIDEIDPPPVIKGNIDAQGNILIDNSTCNQNGNNQPATCGAIFPALNFDLDGNAIQVYILASGSNWTGTVDPDSGEFSLNARLRIRAAGTPLGISLGDSCYVGASGTGSNIHLNPAVSGTIPANDAIGEMSGSPYDSDTGKVTVVNNTVSVPAGSGCGPLGLADGTLNGELGLPSPSGKNEMSLELEFTSNAPQAPAVARYVADPEQGRIPFDVEFDASASTSTLGAIDEYRWDYDGDGETDEVTTEPTVTHTYDVAGVYPTRLTVATQGYETTRHRATITARSIVTTYTQKPDAFSQERNVNFAFESNEPGTFECQLTRNGDVVEDWASCESPVAFPEMEDADYTFKTRAIPVGETSPGLAATWDFRVDNVAPVITIPVKPAAVVKYNQFSFGLDSNEPETSYECRILQDLPVEEPEEGEEPQEPVEPEFEPCDNPADLSWESIEGPVEFQVRGTDRAGNTSDPVSANWTVDLTAPTANISSGPPNPTNAVGGAYSEACDGTQIIICFGTVRERSTTGNLAQAFGFDANEAGSTFICQFNNGEERACLTGVQTGNGVSGANNSFDFDEKLRRLGDQVQGTNTLKVWATDPAGNRQAEPTIRTYVYDTVAPVITALTKPAEFTKNVNNTVIYQANEAVTNFQCRTVNNTGTGVTAFATGTGAPSGFVACDPGQLNPTLGWYTANGQTEGRKGVQVRATDLAGNVLNTNNNVLNNGGLTVYWTVDNTAPVATFAAGTQQQGSYTTNTAATINLSATDAPINFGTAANNIAAQQPAYECSLNGVAFAACATPINLTGLTPGAKSFRVRVTDQATNVSAIIERNWTVVSAANQSVNLTSTPASVIGHRDPVYEFTPSSGTSECRIDATESQNSTGTGWSACTSPKTFTGLSDGNHQVEVRADSSSVPAVHNFAVYANAPTMTLGGQPGVARPDGKRYTGLADNSAALTLTAPANPGYAPGATTFECRYYKTGEVVGPFEDCTSPFSVNWDEQDNTSEMVFQVRPISSTGNTGAQQEVKWTIDSVRPEISWGAPAVATACGRGALNGPGPAGCVATNNSSQPWIRTNVTTPQFRATSTEPIPNSAASFACQLNGGTVQNPCTGRTSSVQATGNPLTVTLGGSRGTNSDAFGTAITQNASNTLRVWAVDNGGNLSVDSVSYTFVHDSVVPTFALTSAAPARTNLGTVDAPLTVSIEASEDMHAETGFACRLINNGTTTTNGTSPGANAPAAPVSGAIGSWSTCPMDLIDPEDPGAGYDLQHASWSADNLAEGNYALDIRGWDTVWNVATGTSSTTRPNVADNNANGRRYIFTIDRTAPVVNITGGPAEAATVPATGGQFTFAPNEAAGQIEKTECRLDPADPDDVDTAEWADCSGTFDFSDLEDGAHIFQVRTLDTAGNQGAPTTRNWTVDSTMPVIDLSSNLNGPMTNQTAVQFNFTVTPVDSTLECRLEGPDGYPALVPVDPEDPEAGFEDPFITDEFAPCASPVELPDMIDGEYTFEVRATNTLGTVGEIETRSWTVDTVVPVANITSGPNAPTKNTVASFGFSSDKAGSTFECQLDGNAATACTSPQQYTGLDDGAHTIKVRAIDSASNASAWVERSWSVDTVAPVTSITSGPTGTVESKSASLEFSADKAGSTFECKMDAGDWASCSSPVSFSGLSNGLHEFRVRATDTLGNLGEIEGRNWAVLVQECPPGQVGEFPDCNPPCNENEIGEPGNCQPKPCPVGTHGTYPDCVPDVCPEGKVGEYPNCVDPDPTVCEDGFFGTPPNCQKLAKPPLEKPNNLVNSVYDPATGKLAIRLKCPAGFKPKCQGTAVAVTGKGKNAKVMSSKVKNTSKAGKWKLVTLTIKPAFRDKVAKMATVDKKQLIVKQTLRSKKKRKKTVFHTYKVRVKG